MIPLLLVVILAQAPLSARVTQAPAAITKPQPPPTSNPPPARPPSRGVSPQFRPMWHGGGGHGHGDHRGGYGAYQYPITVSYRALEAEPAPLIPTNEVTNYGTESLSNYARNRRLHFEKLQTRPIPKEE